MANNYICGINTSTNRIESTQVGDTGYLAGPVDLYDTFGLYKLDGTGNINLLMGGCAAGTDRDWDGIWTAGFNSFVTTDVNHFAGGLSSPGPVAIDINNGDGTSYSSGVIGYSTSAGGAANPSSSWQERFIEGTNSSAEAKSVGADGAANSVKWSNWTEGTHMVNTGSITIDSKANSIAGNRVELGTMSGTSSGIIASFYSEQNDISGFDKSYDLYGNAVDGINVAKLLSRGTLDVSGQATLNGNIILGTSESDSITFNGDTVGHITPYQDNSNDLGSSAKQFKDLYINGTANIDLLKADTLGADMNCNNFDFTNVDINSGAIDNTAIGATTRSTIQCTTLNANSTITATGNISSAADVIAYSSSDERLKDNIKIIDNALSKVNLLRGVEFDWNSNQSTYTGHDVGVVAQDVERVVPEIVNTRENGYKAVKYEKIVPVLIEAIKELSKKVTLLEGSSDRSTSF